MGALPFNTENYGEYRRYIIDLGEDNSETHSILKRNLRRAINEELTERQREMMVLYYIDRIKMTDIAEMLGVAPSTVSRTITRGRKSLRRCLRYGAKELMHDCDPDDLPRNSIR